VTRNHHGDRLDNRPPNCVSATLRRTLDGVGVPLGRYAGIAVLALGTACLPATTAHARPAVWGPLIYSVAAVILYVWIWIATTFHGFLLWSAAILHAGIAAGLLPQL
jgi:hypothetical protein